MKRATGWWMVIGVALTLALGACGGRESAVGDSATQTIAPAQPQPDTSGTDAMTQTVDVEQGRSEAEGRGTEAAGTATSSTTTSTTGTVTTAPPVSTTTQ